MEQNQQLLEQIQQKFLLKQMPAKEYSPLVLAYIGDGIYDMIVRTIFVSYGNTQVDKLNKQASNRVLDGIRDVATRLNAGDIFFCDCCTDCIREFGLYRWDEKAAEDRPLKTDDHAMDDTRYFVRAAFQPSRFSF